jgi:hypothetical protein
MPPERVNPTPEELQWLREFMAAEAERLVQTSGAKAVQDFEEAMGGAAPEVQQAWIESEPSAAAEVASLVVEQAGGEPAGPADAQEAQGRGEDLEAIATRIYTKAVDELRGDEVELDEADLARIWQDAWNEASSSVPGTEDEAVIRVTDSFTLKIMNEIDGDALYEIINGFIDDIKQLISSGS